MEVGAVKQAFNNEIILMKKNLNQAKIQTIHKLTRKAKTLADKKAPESIKEKFNKKAESAVKEVLIIKKIKPKDIAQFIVTHKGQLNDFMNKPLNNDKACARLLLHKAMQLKYKQIREKFSNISIKDLFMSRQERLKLKKEARDKQKNKKKGKDKTVNVEGEWDVEMTNKKTNDTISNDLSEDKGSTNNKSDLDVHSGSDSEVESDKSAKESDNDEDIEEIHSNNDVEIEEQFSGSDDNEVPSEDNSSVKVSSSSFNTRNKVKKESNIEMLVKIKKPENKGIKKPKENKNRNLNEKLQKRNFNKDSNDCPLKAEKVVDPFFITSSGQNYMSVVEPRQPDEVKEVHRQGNRQYRRAVMFGHVPKTRPRKNNDRQTHFPKENQWNSRKFEEKRDKYDRNNKNVVKDEVPEKLHPSWEAKKKQSSILPFQGLYDATFIKSLNIANGDGIEPLLTSPDPSSFPARKRRPKSILIDPDDVTATPNTSPQHSAVERRCERIPI